MANNDKINQVITGESPWYSASFSPFVQGVEIRSPQQLFSFTSPKLRGNISFGRTVDNVLQNQQFFNDSYSPENLGSVGTGSQVNLDSHGKLGIEVIHEVETRDFGMPSPFVGSEPFEEVDSQDPVTILGTHPFELVQPVSLVVASGLSSFNGTIEPFDIRKVVDRSSIELPFISRSIKGSMSITNEKRESFVIGDNTDLRNSSTTPFLDSAGTFGTIDQPGAFSDADKRLAPFNDTDDTELFYRNDTLDTEMRNTMINGFVSASITYIAAPVEALRSSIVVPGHGFQFSQNDNYGYDSIAFGGLLK